MSQAEQQQYNVGDENNAPLNESGSCVWLPGEFKTQRKVECGGNKLLFLWLQSKKLMPLVPGAKEMKSKRNVPRLG